MKLISLRDGDLNFICRDGIGSAPLSFDIRLVLAVNIGIVTEVSMAKTQAKYISRREFVMMGGGVIGGLGVIGAMASI